MSWEPVGDGRYGETDRVCLYNSGKLIQVAHSGIDPLTDALPDDIRLCRQVETIPSGIDNATYLRLVEKHQKLQARVKAMKGLPEEVAETIEDCLGYTLSQWRQLAKVYVYYEEGLAEQERLISEAFAWLDAQNESKESNRQRPDREQPEAELLDPVDR